MIDHPSIILDRDSGEAGIVPGEDAKSLIFLAAQGKGDISIPPQKVRGIYPALTADEPDRLNR